MTFLMNVCNLSPDLAWAWASYLNHEGEICQGRRVHSPSSTGPHDEGDLRDDSWSQHIPLGKENSRFLSLNHRKDEEVRLLPRTSSKLDSRIRCKQERFLKLILKFHNPSITQMLPINQKKMHFWRLNIPGIYLRIQQGTPLPPGCERLQSRSARLRERRPSWPDPWSEHAKTTKLMLQCWSWENGV